MAAEPGRMRTILAPLGECGVLLPNNVVAEVVAYAEPKAFEGAPAWLLGKLDWRDWQVPVISLALLTGVAGADPVAAGSRILIIKTLTDSTSIVYLGVHISGLPKLVALGPGDLVAAEDQPDLPGVFSRLVADGQDALIPELDELTALVERAVYSNRSS